MPSYQCGTTAASFDEQKLGLLIAQRVNGDVIKSTRSQP
jgi:hypothetical protein